MLERVSNMALRVLGGICAVIFEVFTPDSDKEAQIKSIHRTIARMPPARREYLFMQRDEGLKYYEIAERKGVDKEIVLAELSRAYSDLRMAINNDPDGNPAIAREAEATLRRMHASSSLAGA